MECSKKQLGECRVAKVKLNLMQQAHGINKYKLRTKYVAPVVGVLKLKVNASVIQWDSSFAVGMVLRDHQGDFSEERVMKFGRKAFVLEFETVDILGPLLGLKQNQKSN